LEIEKFIPLFFLKGVRVFSNIVGQWESNMSTMCVRFFFTPPPPTKVKRSEKKKNAWGSLILFYSSFLICKKCRAETYTIRFRIFFS